MYWYILGGLNGVSHFWPKMYWYILGGLNGALANVSHFWLKMYWYILGGLDGAPANVSCFWMFSNRGFVWCWGCNPVTHRPRLRKEEAVVFYYWFPRICHHIFWRQEFFLTPLPGKSLPGYKWKNHLAVRHFPARVPWLIQKGPWQSTFPTRVTWYKPTYNVMGPCWEHPSEQPCLLQIPM